MKKHLLALTVGVALGAGVVTASAFVASYPTTVVTFTTKTTGDVIQATHINAIQDEIVAIENALLNGFAHNLLASGTRTLGSSSVFWDKGYLTALVLGAETTAGVRFDVSGGTVRVREGDNSTYAPLEAFSLNATNTISIAGSSINSAGVLSNVAYLNQTPIFGVTVRAPLYRTDTGLVTTTNGGSTPAFTANMVGSTGGPTTTAQNGWLLMQDAGGAAIWIPVWK